MLSIFADRELASMKKAAQTLERRHANDRARLARLEREEAIHYAEQGIAQLERHGKVIKDRRKEVERLAAMRSHAERQAHLEHIRLDYAEKPWARNSDNREAPTKIPDALEVLHYAEENKIDASTDAGLRRCVEALTA